jgi:hypothetical protein
MSLAKTKMSQFPRVGQMMIVALSFLALPTTQAAGMDAKERAAKIACLKGDYTKGVGLLAELFVSTSEAVFIFNQGRCFEQNGKYEEAILRFREFQRKNADAGLAPNDQAERHAQAEKHIVECQALLDKQKPAAVEPAAPPVAPPTPVGQPVPAAQPILPVIPQVAPPEPSPIESPPEEAASPKPSEPASEGRGLRMAGLVTAGVGLGAIVTGVILNLKANSLAKDLEAANDSKTTLYSTDKESTRANYQTWGGVAYGAGAACLAGGAVLYFLGMREAHTPVAFVPTLADGHVGASLQGAF